MRAARILLSLSVLVVPVVTAAPAAASGGVPHVPEDCAVPPFIDLRQYNVIIGTNRSEVLRGTPGKDFICARLGHDVIYSYGGDDLVLGDTTTFFGNVEAAGGNDVVFAGWGSDEVLPGPGDDRVFGEGGADFIALAVGNDVGYGGPGNDEIIGGFGRDTIDGGPGNDTIAGGFDADVLMGREGNDMLAGELPPGTTPPPGVPVPGPARDVCHGGQGTDSGLDCDVRTSVEGSV